MAVVPSKRENFAQAACGASDGVGAVVYIKGPPVGGKYQVETADPTDFDKMPAIAMIIQKSSPTATECWIQFRGEITDVYGSLVPGEMLFVDETGGLSDEPPEPTVLEPFKFSQNIGVSLAPNIIGFDPDLTLTRRRL